MHSEQHTDTYYIIHVAELTTAYGKNIPDRLFFEYHPNTDYYIQRCRPNQILLVDQYHLARYIIAIIEKSKTYSPDERGVVRAFSCCA